jgi:hypothetical protein
MLAEGTVLIALGSDRLILLPQQRERDPFALELAMDLRPVRGGAHLRGHRLGKGKQQTLQRRLIEPLGQRPGQTGVLGPADVLRHRGSSYPTAPRNLALA